MSIINRSSNQKKLRLEIKIKYTGRLRQNWQEENEIVTQTLELILNLEELISLFTIYSTCVSVKTTAWTTHKAKNKIKYICPYL